MWSALREQGTSLDLARQESPEHIRTTRRGFLRASAIAILNYSVIAEGIANLSQLLHPRVEFRITDKAVTFLCDGVERWKIDATQFAGAPRLLTQRRQGYVRVQLVNARYPGTLLPADLSCELREVQYKWVMDLSLTLGGFSCRIPFEEWLTGNQPAEARVVLDNRVASLALEGSLSFKGHGTLAFTPSWTLQLSGQGITQFRNYNSDLKASDTTISLVKSDWPGIAIHSEPYARTVVEVSRRSEAWNYTPPIGNLSSGCLVCQSTAFDALQVELWEDGGRTGYAFLAEARAETGSTTWFGSPIPVNEEGWLSQGVSLAGSVYAAVMPIHGTPEQRFWANLTPGSFYLTHLGYGFEVSAPPEQPHFEIRRLGSQAEFTCAPIIKQVSVPLEGCVVEPIQIALGPRFPLSLSDEQIQELHLRGPQPDWHQLEQGSETEGHSKAQLFRVSNHSVDADLRAAHDPDIPGGLLLKIVRPEDLLVITLRIYGFELQLSKSAKPKLIRSAKALPTGFTRPLLVVYLPPQHIAEEVRDNGAPLNQFRAVLSSWSHLVFEIPDSILVIPYEIDRLLDWSAFQPVLAPNASSQLRDGGSVTSASLATVTSIEAPSRLFISPNLQAAWIHSRKPKSLNGRYELWHTRLSAKGLIDTHSSKELVEKPSVRVIFTPNLGQDSDASLGVLSQKDRTELVQLQSCSSIGENGSFIEVNQLMLSALGASLDMSYEAPNPKCVTAGLSIWKQKIMMGRDQFISVTRDGCLMPFGHRAALVTETKRKFIKYQGRMCAVLERSEWIEVREPIKMYPQESRWPTPSHGRRFPFRAIQITPETTPKIDQKAGRFADGDGFWIYVSGVPYLFHIVAKGLDGVRQEWDQPLVFVESTVCSDSRKMNIIISEYQDDPSKRNEPRLNQQAVALVSYSERGENKYHVEMMRCGAEVVESSHSSEDHLGRPERGEHPLSPNVALVQLNKDRGGNRFRQQKPPSPEMTKPPHLLEKEGEGGRFKQQGPPSREMPNPPYLLNQEGTPSSGSQTYFLPLIAEWSIRVPSIETLLKGNLSGTRASAAGTSIRITYHDQFVKVGFDKDLNPGEVFAKLVTPVPLRFPSDKVGGLAKPDIDIIGLSRCNGPVGGPGNNVAKIDRMLTALMTAQKLRQTESTNAVAAKDFFIGQGVNEGGELLNATLLGAISLKDIIGEAEIPRLTTTVHPSPPATPEIVTTQYQFEVTKFTKQDQLFRPYAKGNTRLTLESTVKNYVQRQSSDTLVKGTLTEFQLTFGGVLHINFDEVRFHSTQGSKFDVSVTLHSPCPIELGREKLGPFALLTKVLERAGLGNAIIEPIQDGIRVGLAMGLPPIATGFWSVENLKLRVALEISFAGRPLRLYLGFSSSEDRFLLAASLLGGGGYLEIIASTRGLERFKGALEFGGVVSINLYIVAAKAEVLAGFYVELDFSEPKSDPEPIIGGYWRVCAFVQLLQFISVSIEIGLGLTYVVKEDKLVGTGWAALGLDLLFYSKTLKVSVSMELPVEALVKRGRESLPFDPLELVQDNSINGQSPFAYLVSNSSMHRKQSNQNSDQVHQRSSFSELISSKDWEVYAHAFAPGPWM